MDYYKLQKDVFNYLLKKNDKGKYAFSLRKKGGDPQSYFTGTQKSNYFAFNFWSIGINYPGASIDLITYQIQTYSSGHLTVSLCLHQTNSPQDDQNTINLNFIKELYKDLKLKNIDSKGIVVNQKNPPSTNSKMYGVKFKILNVEEGKLIEQLDVLISETKPIIDKIFIKYKNKYPNWKAHRYKTEETNKLIELRNQYRERKNTVLFKGKKEGCEDLSLNTILFGPPGTGKTFASVNHALSIIEGKTVKEITEEERELIRNRYKKYVKEERIMFTTFHQSYAYEDFVEGIRPDTKNGKLTYTSKDGIFKLLVLEALKNLELDYVLIIDEINRGNISDIFGELITLLESSKRKNQEEETQVQLPYSKQKDFMVPSNIYIVGTMNTADRSISVLDTALRRRFNFIETPPSYEVIKKNVGNDGVIENGNIDIVELLKIINNRISYLLDKDHLIGHSYFLDVKNKEDLVERFSNNIIPLLEEYFHNDYINIQRVFGDNNEWKKPEEHKVFSVNDQTDGKLFGTTLEEFSDKELFYLNPIFKGEGEVTDELFTSIYTKG